MNKEEIYDNEISPLMRQILEICKRGKIAMVASFFIPTPDDEDLMCSSCLLDEEYDAPQSYHKAMRQIRQGDNFTMAMTITSAERG